MQGSDTRNKILFRWSAMQESNHISWNLSLEVENLVFQIIKASQSTSSDYYFKPSLFMQWCRCPIHVHKSYINWFEYAATNAIQLQSLQTHSTVHPKILNNSRSVRPHYKCQLFIIVIIAAMPSTYWSFIIIIINGRMWRCVCVVRVAIVWNGSKCEYANSIITYCVDCRHIAKSLAQCKQKCIRCRQNENTMDSISQTGAHFIVLDVRRRWCYVRSLHKQT